MRLAAIAVSSVLAGIGGALTAYSSPTLSPASFMVVGSLVAVALTYLSGISSVTGAIVAGALAQSGLIVALTNDGGASNDSKMFAISGVALVLGALFVPDGMTGLARRVAARVLPAQPVRSKPC